MGQAHRAPRRAGWRGVPAVCLALAGAAQAAQTGEAGGFFTANAELASGYERYTAPLIQVSETGALTRLDGLGRLAGRVTRLSASGTVGHTAADGSAAHLSASFLDKSSPQAPTLGFRLLSIDPMLSLPLGEGSLSAGYTVQKIDVAERAFRYRRVAHADWTRATPDGGYVSYVVEYALNRHVQDFELLDGRAAGAIARRSFHDPLPGVAELSAEMGYSREHNSGGSDAYSNRVLHARLSVEVHYGDLGLALGWMHLRAGFDAPEFDGQRARRDRFNLFELTASYPLGKAVEARLEWTGGRNAANSPLYQNRFTGTLLGLSIEI